MNSDNNIINGEPMLLVTYVASVRAGYDDKQNRCIEELVPGNKKIIRVSSIVSIHDMIGYTIIYTDKDNYSVCEPLDFFIKYLNVVNKPISSTVGKLIPIDMDTDISTLISK